MERYSSLHKFIIIASVDITDGKEDLRFVQTEILIAIIDTLKKSLDLDPMSEVQQNKILFQNYLIENVCPTASEVPS